MVQDETSKSLSGMFLQRPSNEPESEYLARVMTLLEEQNVYKIEHKAVRVMTCELLDPELIQGSEMANEKWMKYVDKYTKMDTDPELSVYMAQRNRQVFLPRNKRKTGFGDNEHKAMENVVLCNNLECKICVNTYKMYFVTQSEDYLHRKREPAPADKQAQVSFLFEFMMMMTIITIRKRRKRGRRRRRIRRRNR